MASKEGSNMSSRHRSASITNTLLLRFLPICAVGTCPDTAFAYKDRLYLGFGEIPFVADSFKPAIGVSRKYAYFEFGIIYQFRDELNRGKDSFNAQFGQDGLISSKETTRDRIMLQGKLYPWQEYFYVSFGLMAGGADEEKITFDNRSRQIGSGRYNTSLDVTIARDRSVEPVAGIGFSIPVTDSLSVTTDFTMGWFGEVADPSIAISTSSNVAQADRDALESSIRDNYKSNVHNRYHVFNIGIQHVF